MVVTYSKSKHGEEIAITGMSGRFPNSNDIYHFRDNLFNKVNGVSTDHRRWRATHPEVPHRIGTMFNIDKFDAGFFGVSQRHANNMDAMTRMVLERVYEAILDAGYHPSDLEGSNTGVYLGSCFSETEKSSFFNNVIGSGSITGCQRSMLPKRISYFFKFNGIAFVTDTACSSSLFALEHAYRHMKEGVCRKAIVCGTHVCLDPAISLQLARLGALSADGLCKSFDDEGNGYVRSEAITVLILEKASDAKRVYAEIIHSKTNCDGYKEQGITFPSSDMQKILLKEFYEECDVDPTNLTFLEAHGTGTKIGDPEELTSLDDFFCERRSNPLHIGSTKSNIGHTEPTSGLCSIVKVLIGFESGFIPPNINYSTPRKGVEAFEKHRLIVVTEKMPFPDENGLVGVNNFGFGGANSHVLLRWNPKLKINNGIPKDDLPRLVCVSGRTKGTVTSTLTCAEKLDVEYTSLLHSIFQKTIPGQLYNGYMITSKLGEIEKVISKNSVVRYKLRVRFTNVDQEWYHLGSKLMEIPMFSDAMQRIYKILENELNLNIWNIITTNKGNKISSTLGTVAVQLALADIIRNLHLHIHEIVGVGFGELAAAYLDGYLTLEESLLIAYFVSFGNTTSIKDTFTKKIFRPKKWSPAFIEDKRENHYPQGSLEYFITNISKPTNHKEQDKVNTTKNNIITMIVGRQNNYQTDKDILLIGNHNVEPLIELLQSFGRLFLLGFPSKLDSLYPKITHPVSRGTPMISPHIKWNHMNTYTVHSCQSEEECKSGQRIVYISLRMEAWKFMDGHVVNGRILLPVTVYLNLVWESYATIVDKLMSDTGIIFEDIRFLRATNIRLDETLTFKVSIQLKNKLFEVMENDALIVSGRVYALNGKCKTVSTCDPSKAWNKIWMNKNDVYKELRLRGYNYSNKFRSIKSFDFQGNQAIISWNSNWVTFLDGMLQVQLLSENTRDLYVPIGIKRVVIDAPQHIKYTSNCNNEILVVYSRDSGMIAGGGIEVSGLETEIVSKRRSAEPLLETYKFIPYAGKLEQQQVIRCMVQTILENSNTIKVKAVEILDHNEIEEPIMPIVQQTLDDLPLILPELKILSNKKYLDLPGIMIENKALNSESACHILVVRNILQKPELLLTALKVTDDVSGYIITKESEWPPIEKIGFIQVLSSYETEAGHVLLIKEASKYIARIPINISSIDDLSWLQQIRANTDRKVVLYSQNSPFNGLLGLVTCLRREPFGNNISAVLVMDDAPPFDIEDEFYKSQLEKNLVINVLKDKNWGSYRHLLLPNVEGIENAHCYVNATISADFSGVKWIEGPLSMETVPDEGQELVHVYYSAINYKDTIMASRRLSTDVITRDRTFHECMIGLEFSGKLINDPSKRVMGLVANGALSTMVMADSQLLWQCPGHWSLEDAVTVPMVYATVLYSFIIRGHMNRGQSVLILSGAGSVGQAAINIATHFGCTIFTTVDTCEEREFIRERYQQIKNEYIEDSRSMSVEQMILNHTNGRGVDFVLNSLTEEKLQSSIRCLAYNGAFLDIGMLSFPSDNQLASALLRKQARYERIVLDKIFTGLTETKKLLSTLMREGILNGSVKPLVRAIYSSEKVEEAFRFMTTEQHMGKLLIKVRNENYNEQSQLYTGIPRLSCKESSCYVILGGLGGFGLELADWLITRGAKQLVLISRTGVKTSYQSYRLNIFKSCGVNVFVRKDDLSSKKGCMTLLKFAESVGPIEGIFNLAMILKDDLFKHQTTETFKTMLAAKAYATRHLDAISRKMCPNLRYFVAFSSTSCGRGNIGQTNYGMANSVMERICERRKLDGYPALAIQWGPIGEVGLIAELQEDRNEVVLGGNLQQKVSSCLRILDRLLKQDEPVVSSMIVAEKHNKSGATSIFDVVLNIIGIKNLKLVNFHASFPELGVDSIIASEIKQTLEREYEVFLTIQDIRNMTIAKLEDLIPEQAVQSKVKTDPPEDLVLLLKHVGDEEYSYKPIVEIKYSGDVSDDSPPVFALAGIEGMGGIFDFIGRQLNRNLTCLQLCADNYSDSVEKIAEPLVKIADASSSSNFTLIAYSFGCVIATELMYALESLGKIGKAFFIDGAPEMITRLVKTHLPLYDDESFQTTLLCILMARYVPFEVMIEHKASIIEQETYEDKIKYILSILPHIKHSEKYITNIYNASLNRLKAVRKYEPRAEKLNSTITLAKPTKQSSLDLSHDYNLSSLTKRPVEVKIIEGDHVSILESKQLAREIQVFLKYDRKRCEIPSKGTETV